MPAIPCSIDLAAYERQVAAATADPGGYWREEAARLDWMVPFTTVKDSSFDEADFRIRWFADGQLTVSVNCLDRHLVERGVPNRPDHEERSRGRWSGRDRGPRSPGRRSIG